MLLPGAIRTIHGSEKDMPIDPLKSKINHRYVDFAQFEETKRLFKKNEQCASPKGRTMSLGETENPAGIRKSKWAERKIEKGQTSY